MKTYKLEAKLSAVRVVCWFNQQKKNSPKLQKLATISKNVSHLTAVDLDQTLNYLGCTWGKKKKGQKRLLRRHLKAFVVKYKAYEEVCIIS